MKMFTLGHKNKNKTLLYTMVSSLLSPIFVSHIKWGPCFIVGAMSLVKLFGMVTNFMSAKENDLDINWTWQAINIALKSFSMHLPLIYLPF